MNSIAYAPDSNGPDKIGGWRKPIFTMTQIQSARSGPHGGGLVG